MAENNETNNQVTNSVTTEKKSMGTRAMDFVEEHFGGLIFGTLAVATIVSVVEAGCSSKRKDKIELRRIDADLEASKYYSDQMRIAIVEAERVKTEKSEG